MREVTLIIHMRTYTEKRVFLCTYTVEICIISALYVKSVITWAYRISTVSNNCQAVPGISLEIRKFIIEGLNMAFCKLIKSACVPIAI